MINILLKKQQGAHEHTPAQVIEGDFINHEENANNGFVTEPYVCDQLIKGYLNPEQEAFLRPILRILKKPYQVELCVALMDYMETGIADIPQNTTLGALFMQLTRVGLPEYDNPNDKRIIRPLRNIQK